MRGTKEEFGTGKVCAVAREERSSAESEKTAPAREDLEGLFGECQYTAGFRAGKRERSLRCGMTGFSVEKVAGHEARGVHGG